MPISAPRFPAARPLGAAALAGLLAGCDMIVMKPHGDIAQQQAQLIVIATALMLLIIVPVIALTLFFAWRYRKANTKAPYTPDWDHSTRLELLIWGVPLLIIIALGAITWISTHKLDPYRPLDRIDADRPVPAGMEPLQVNVVAMDWKWLFIYPEQGIATVNELAAPVDRPIRFHLTASSVMNSFYIPALAGQIYTMPGMETQLHAVINKPGDYDGLLRQLQRRRLLAHALPLPRPDAGRLRRLGGGQPRLRRGPHARGLPAARAAERTRAGAPLRQRRAGPVRRHRQPCVEPGKMCMHEMMHIDAQGGAGKGGVGGVSLPARAQRPPALGRRRRVLHRSRRATSPPRPLMSPIFQPAPLAPAPAPMSDLSTLIFGRLSWAAIPFHDPIILATFVGVALGGFVVLAVLTRYRLWGTLWRDWICSASTTRRSASCTWCWAW